MDKTEALQLAEDVLKRYRTFKFDQLAQLVDSSEHLEVVGRSGVTYQVDVQVFWDDRENGPLRVTAAVDNGGIRAFFPLSKDFILAPDGSFVGE